MIFLYELFKSCRPNQWTKNLLIFSAPIFAFNFNWYVWQKNFYTLIAFCCISSAIYLINDIVDIKDDQKHPIKSLRPIAAGKVGIKKAKFFAIFLIFFSLIFSFSIAPYLTNIILIYFLIQLAYCFYLKQKPILDLFCISSAFLLRGISGGVASSLKLSPWFLLSIGLLALFLAIEKRKAEIYLTTKLNIKTRKVLERYSIDLLIRYESIVSTGAFISYALWASGPTLNGAPTSLMLITVPFVLFGIFRYQLISDPIELERQKLIFPDRSIEKPEDILWQDTGIKYVVLFWLIITVIIGLTY